LYVVVSIEGFKKYFLISLSYIINQKCRNNIDKISYYNSLKVILEIKLKVQTKYSCM